MAIDTAEIDLVTARVRVLAGADVAGVTRDQLLDVQEAVARLERVVGALGSRVAGEVARRSTADAPGGGFARREGHGDATSMVASVRGASKATARRAIDAGAAFDAIETETPGPGAPRQRERYPHVARAQVEGHLSVESAGLICSALTELAEHVDTAALLDLEERLVAKATGLAAHQVRRIVSRAIARASDAARERRERKNHDDRYFAFKEDHQGVVTFHGRLDVVSAAPVLTVLEQIVTRDMRARRGQDPSAMDQRTVGQMRADALVEMSRHTLGCDHKDASGVRTTVVVRMGLADLLSGTGLGSIDGIDAPVSVGELRRLTADAGLIPQVLGGESDILDQGRRVRMFTRAQRLALLERDGGCAKCHAPPEHCEAHHIDWWQHGGTTNISNGVMLCTRCHHDIHRQSWGIRATPTSVQFVPPTSIDPTRQVSEGGRRALDVLAPGVPAPDVLGLAGPALDVAPPEPPGPEPGTRPGSAPDGVYVGGPDGESCGPPTEQERALVRYWEEQVRATEPMPEWIGESDLWDPVIDGPFAREPALSA
ncbi:HNH endonuclease [Demequina sp. B12]|uniref:HNH endonuclease signature motif containing protein n=1 Tax=Demequina sp. B12 TaxID=2992757 RepID=UPI00237A3239|nr:HNH endonuclease signature motif containing protein [Demequina sp. B12]MDE0573747.1 HNH endonuclease [Demequina sp. B12]